MNTVKMLLFSPHPDDAEIFCGGVIALSASQGHRVAVVDMTLGEMGSQGDVETRKKESAAASIELGNIYRENLELPDSFLNCNDFQQIDKVVQCIRKYKPEVIFAPYFSDRHPDHEATSDIITKSFFYSGLVKYKSELGEKHSAKQLVYYQMRQSFNPTFIVDVSSVYDKKMASIKCHSSQIYRKKEPTLINSSRAITSINARDQFYGAMIGAAYGEPFWTKTAISIDNPVEYFSNHRLNEILYYPGK